MKRIVSPYLLVAALVVCSSPSFGQIMYADLSGAFVLSNFAAESEAEPDWGLMASPHITFSINPTVELGVEVTYTYFEGSGMLESILSDIDDSYHDYPPDNYGMFSASLFSRVKMPGRDLRPFVSLGVGFYAVDGSGFLNYGNLEDWRDRNSGELIAQPVRYVKGFFSFGLGAVLPIDQTGDILLEARMWNSFDLTERFFPLSLSFRFKL